MDSEPLTSLSPADMAFLKRLHDLDPRWSFFRDDAQGGQLTAELLSQHPQIQTPLRVVVGGAFTMSWYAGAFFEVRSLSMTAWSDALDLVAGFLDETIWHAVAYEEGHAVSLGTGREDDWKKWHPCFDHLEVKTWRGGSDKTIVIKEGRHGCVSIRSHVKHPGPRGAARGPADAEGPLV